MNPPDVSVIIVTHNTCSLTCAAIESIFSANEGITREAIVVDNASTDGTAEAVRQMFPFVKYHLSECNLGFARANNVGARMASGELLLLLNSDARLQAESLERAVNWMRANNDCGVAGAQLLNPDGSRQNSIANYPTLATELLNKSLLRRLFPARFPGKEIAASGPMEVESVIGAFLATPRLLWERLGGLDEDYFFYLEETDYCLRVRQAGFKVMHLPQVLVWHEQGQSANQKRVAARIEYWRSRYRYFEKRHGRFARALLRTGLLVRLGANWASNGLAALLCLGRLGTAQKFAGHHQIALWHLRGRPGNMGLRPGVRSCSSALR